MRKKKKKDHEERRVPNSGCSMRIVIFPLKCNNEKERGNENNRRVEMRIEKNL